MRHMRIRQAGLALLVAGALALPANAGTQPGVAGTWTGTARGIAGSRQFEEDFTMALTQNGTNVRGTFSQKIETGGKAKSGRERDNIPVHGTITGNKLSLTIGKGRSLEATIDGDTMDGSIMAAKGTPHHLTAARVK